MPTANLSFSISALAIWFAATGAPVAFAQGEFASGNWLGAAYSNDDGSFAHCAMSASYTVTNDQLIFSLGKDLTFGVGVANEAWQLQVGQKAKIVILIDNFPPETGEATALSSKQIASFFQRPKRLFQSLRAGKAMTIYSEGSTLKFSLEGTRNALARLAGCVSSSLASTSTNTANSGAGSSSLDRLRISEAELVVYAANILSQAGTSGYRMMTRGEVRSLTRDAFSVGWRNIDQSFGGLDGYNLASFGQTNEQIFSVFSSGLLKSDADGCTGSFASGFKDEPSSSEVQLKRLFTACQPKRGASWRWEYLLILAPGQRLLKLISGGLSGQSTLSDSTATSPDFLTVAASNFRSTGGVLK